MTLSIGHFYLARLGHYHLAATAFHPSQIANRHVSPPDEGSTQSARRDEGHWQCGAMIRIARIRTNERANLFQPALNGVFINVSTFSLFWVSLPSYLLAKDPQWR
jgi:hypothetical protein